MSISISDINCGVIACDLESGNILWTEGNPSAKIERGLGGALLLTLLLKNLANGKIKLNDYVTVGETPARDSSSKGSIGLAEGDKLSVHKLVGAMVCQNSPDAILALSEKLYSQTGRSTLKGMQDLAMQLGIGEGCVKNITGRLLRAKPQSFCLSDMNAVAAELFSYSATHLKLLNTTSIEYKGRLFSTPSQLVARGKIYGGYLFGEENGEGIVLSYIGGRKVALSICGARDSFHRDYLLSYVIDRLVFTPDSVDTANPRGPICIPADKPGTINFLGDTYFGEDYMLKRQAKGERNILSEFGYDYSFEAIAPLLAKGDINIANFEAALTDSSYSRLLGIKPYILGGRIDESTAALKRQSIHIVTLGNNHAMDYESPGLFSTLDAFKSANIPAIGAGCNGRDSSEPVRLNICGCKITIFSCYWYRQQAYMDFDFYATGSKPGVTCLNGEVLDRIKEEKQSDPNAFIIVLVHWGVDFQLVQATQRNHAEQLLDYGADLIVGHGAHMMQEINRVRSKWVVYSIGNGVFNSNGEYDIRNVPPYSFLLQLHIENAKAERIRLYPLYSNNLNTLWKTHVTNDKQFEEVLEYQSRIGTKLELFKKGTDEFGQFIEAYI